MTPVDKDTLKKLGGTATNVRVEYSRKVADGNYGSLGASMAIEMQLGADADPNVAADGLYAWVESAVSRSLKATYDQLPHPERSEKEPETSPSTPPPPPPALPLPEPAPGENVPDFVTLEHPSIAHIASESGTHHCKVFGGMWTKFGVRVWPEVLSAAGIDGWESWPLGEKYQLPKGLTKALVAVEEEGDKVKPLKVIAFR